MVSTVLAYAMAVTIVNGVERHLDRIGCLDLDEVRHAVVVRVRGTVWVDVLEQQPREGNFRTCGDCWAQVDGNALLPNLVVKLFIPEEAIDAQIPDSQGNGCLLYTSPSPRDGLLSRMPSSA